MVGVPLSLVRHQGEASVGSGRHRAAKHEGGYRLPISFPGHQQHAKNHERPPGPIADEGVHVEQSSVCRRAAAFDDREPQLVAE